MSQTLLSAGIDIGTTTTQVIFSRLTVRNQASPWQVPELTITDKTVVFAAPICTTPLVDGRTIDAPAVSRLIRRAYEQAGVEPQQVQTGAVIITGETARKDNADQVLHAISDLAGDFVVATAGPALEGILAGMGAGCGELSRSGAVLNLDMGGGTTNMALFREGQAVDNGCLNIGGRLLAYDADHRLTYRSPVLEGYCDLKVGDRVDASKLLPVAGLLTRVLEQALGLEPPSELPHFITDHPMSMPNSLPRLCFSGGVAACMEQELPWDAFGDLGVLLARCIMESAIWKLPRVQARQTIRATVVGAGSHSTTLSGSTIDIHRVTLPQKNLPVVFLNESEEALPSAELASLIRSRRSVHEGQTVVAFRGSSCRHFADLRRLAEALIASETTLIATGNDCAKALGQTIRSMAPDRPVLCIDGLTLQNGMYLDMGRPVGQALPVVIKTLIFN